MIWDATGGDTETINRLTDLLVTMNTEKESSRLFQIIKPLYRLIGIPFSAEAEPMGSDPDVLDYFFFFFTADFGEVIQDIFTTENKHKKTK